VSRAPRLGQHLLADPNLLDAIVREAELRPDDVVLEVGPGEGALTERIAPAVARVHAIELDRRRFGDALDAVAEAAGNVQVVWGDAMRIDLAAIEPAPATVVSNLPYSVATPLILRTIEELPSVERWTLMVQREIADRLRAEPGGRVYGSPSVLVQLACEIRLLRPVGRRVFKPPPRVDSALIALRRRGPAASPELRALVREAFAHRRKSLARSLELVVPGRRDRVRAALEKIGLAADARAETLAPEDFARLAESLGSAIVPDRGSAE
jgi:16S rRNA (adenine1518-N6/adenine1519-N6)-dimethyltransferase